MCTINGCTSPKKARGLCSKHYNADYYQRNAERERQRSAEWRRENPNYVGCTPEQAAARQRAYYRRDPQRGIAAAANQRAKRLGVDGLLTADGIRARFSYFADRCWVCGEAGADSIDHVKPLNKGGANHHSNIRPAHLGCNAARSWEGRRK